jgi:hypothetical protein
MFKSAWKESTLENSVPLPLATTQDFISFLDWLYFRRMPSPLVGSVGSADCCNCGGPCVGPNNNPLTSSDTAAQHLEDEAKIEALIETDNLDELTGLYIFADQVDIPSLREQLLDQEWRNCVIKETGMMMGFADIVRRFRNLPASSAFCRLQIDEYVRNWSPLADTHCYLESKIRSKLPNEFTFALAAKLAETTSTPWLRGVSSLCDYHGHPQDEKSRSNCAKRLQKEEVLPAPTWRDIEA